MALPASGLALLARHLDSKRNSCELDFSGCHVNDEIECSTRMVMQQPDLLKYRNYRYLKFSSLLMVAAIMAYIFHHPDLGAYGGTWLGFTLGGIGATTVLVLLWYGIHKRRIQVHRERRKVRDHSSSAIPHQVHRQDRRVNQSDFSRRHVSTRQGWLSAHVYFGLSLIVIITLHTGFHFGWNVQTLAYGLMIAVIISGLYGVYSYIRFPPQIMKNLGSETLDSLLHKISRLNEQTISLADRLPQEIKDVVRWAAKETTIGGGAFEQLMPHRFACPTSIAVKKLHDLGKNLDVPQSRLHRELYSHMLRKEVLVNRVRRDISLRAKLEIWLYVHVPLAIALFVALATHIFSIFFYW